MAMYGVEREYGTDRRDWFIMDTTGKKAYEGDIVNLLPERPKEHPTVDCDANYVIYRIMEDGTIYFYDSNGKVQSLKAAWIYLFHLVKRNSRNQYTY
jgi:hypothetical protein